MNKTIRPATEAEKEALYDLLMGDKGIRFEHAYHDQMLGDTISIWFDDRWVGGFGFQGTTDNLVGGFIPEIQGTGLWIEVWPDMINWAHEVHPENILMHCENESIADLMIKMGAINKIHLNPAWTQVTFTKDTTAEFLNNNPNLGK
jgi:hypothetical protein